MLPLKFFDKNREWCDLVQSEARPSMLLPTYKLNNFKEKNQQDNLIAIFLSQINPHKHISMKINIFRIYQGVGGGGGLSPRSRRNFKKIKQNGGFSLFFFCFLARLPISPKL